MKHVLFNSSRNFNTDWERDLNRCAVALEKLVKLLKKEKEEKK